ncbi:hypothetical protein V8E54_006226 [Elaphomyces granulatus]|jgi:hypothetical protein
MCSQKRHQHFAPNATLCAMVAEESGKMEKRSSGLPPQLQPAAQVKTSGGILMAATIRMYRRRQVRILLSPQFLNVMFTAAKYVFSILFYDDALIVPAHSDAYKAAIDVKQ